MHRDLTFLGEGYLESLAEAWEALIEIRKAEHGTKEIDGGALIKEFLKGNEPSDLSMAKAIYCKGSPSTKGKEVISSLSGIESPARVPTQPAGRSILDPIEQHIGYDPEDPGLGVHVLSPIPEGETPPTAESRLEPGQQLFFFNIRRAFAFHKKLSYSNTCFS